jgi:CRISPR-associated endonuclease Csn1
MKNDEELGIVKTAILELETAIQDSGARTLGEYLYKLAPAVAKRRRWTGRSMYVTELDAILDSQAKFHSITSDLRRELVKVVFDQKPLKSQAGRIGRCSLETSRKRMLLAHPVAQEFMMLQKLNDLRAVDDIGVETVPITQSMRDLLAGYLQINGDTTFAQVRSVLGLAKTVRFNFEREDERKLLGNRTQATLAKVADLGQNLQGIVEDLLSIDEETGLIGRLTGRWELDAATSKALSAAKLESGYLMHSRKAVTRLLPLMRAGTPYTTSVKTLYENRYKPTEAAERLPLVHDAYPYLANPLVARAIGELRKLTHAIVKKYGKPEKIRLELHRHLQMGPKRRREASIRMRARQKEKETAATALLKECGTTDPTPWQIERVLLAEECGWKCPFTNKPISYRSLMRDESSFYVIHLVPFAMSLDDDWRNKTLAHVSVGETRKDSLLSELWTSEKERGPIEARFGDFQGAFAKEKLRRFQLTREEAVQEYDDAYAERFIESSSYVARLSREYLSKLYGTDVKVEVTRGRVTSFVREAVGLSRLRREMNSDYRQHIFDAVAVALTSTQTVRGLCTAAKVGDRRRFGSFPAPWSGFVEDVADAINKTVVSFRVTKRVRGPLHEETNYSRPMTDTKGSYHLSRKHLASMTKADVELVAGKQIRKTIAEALNGNDPKKLFADPTNLPVFNGRVVRRVRVVRREVAFSVGEDERFVTTEQNHHALVHATPTTVQPKGMMMSAPKETWTRDIVSLYEARRRLVAGEPVYGDGLLTIAPGEIFQVRWRNSTKLVRVRSVSKDPRVSYVAVEDCRKLKSIIEAKELYRESVEQLRQRQLQKVHVNLLGEVRRDGT